VLEPTKADMWTFPTLDIRILSKVCDVLEERDGLMYNCVQSYSILYDKRREKCYEGIPIAQYTHVSSNVGENVGNSILLGQLHRYRELIQDKDNFIFECALLIVRMQYQGYPAPKLHHKLLLFLKKHPDMFDTINYRSLFDDIIRRCDDVVYAGLARRDQ
jgi:hypothetical protein